MFLVTIFRSKRLGLSWAKLIKVKLRQTLYKVQIMHIPVLNILSFQIKERVASDTIIFDSNPYVILRSFAKRE